MTQILGNLFIDAEGTIEDRTGNHSITVVGDTIISSDKYSEFNNSTSSIYFAGTGDYLKIPASNDFVFGSSDFTVDFWVWQNTLQPGTTDRGIITFGAWGTSGSLLIFDTNDPSWNIIMNGSQNYISTPMKEVWLHTAFVRTDNTLSVYYNGVLEASLDCTGQNFTAKTNIYIAARPYSLTGRNFAGYMDNIRVVNGQALWTENFDLTEDALFYKSASNYVRPGTVRGMYNLSSKKGNLRGKAKSGFVRPTIGQFFTSKNFEEIESGPKHDIFGDGSAVATYLLDGDAKDLGGNYDGNWVGTESYDEQGAVFESSSYISIPNNLIPLNSFTVSFWMREDVAGHNKRIVCDSGINKTSIGSNSGDIWVKYPSGTTLTRDTNSEASVLCHVVISSSDNGTTYIYINNTEISATTTNNVDYASSFSAIGGGYTNKYGFIGMLNRVRIFNRALTASEVSVLYNE